MSSGSSADLHHHPARLTAGMPPSPGGCASSLLLRVEVGQQAERALEHFRGDKARGQALGDLQAGQHCQADGPGLDQRRGLRGQLASVGVG